MPDNLSRLGDEPTGRELLAVPDGWISLISILVRMVRCPPGRAADVRDDWICRPCILNRSRPAAGPRGFTTDCYMCSRRSDNWANTSVLSLFVSPVCLTCDATPLSVTTMSQ